MSEQIFVEIKLNKRITQNKSFCSIFPRGEGGVLLEILGLVGVCSPVLQILTPFQTEGRNYVNIRYIRAQKKQFLKFVSIHGEFAYFSFSLTHLELKRLIRSYTPVVFSKTIPDSRPKWAKCISVFRPKRRKNPTRWGGK